MQTVRLLPTPRLLLLAVFPLFLWAASSLTPFLWVFALLGALAAVGLAVRDWQQSLKPDQFSVDRAHNRKFTIREQNEVKLIVQNHADQPIQLTLRDGLPPTFQANASALAHDVSLDAFRQTAVSYRVKPTRRGEYGFGPIAVQWRSPWGLFVQQMTLPVFSEAKVYPSLLEIKLYDKLIRQGNTIYSGVRRHSFSGEGGDFEQLRDYLPDDDYRRINWNATAKYGRPITMEFSPERSQNVIVMVDTGRRMLSRPLGEARTTRLDLIINAVLMFSFVAISRADRVGLLTFDEKVNRYMAPRSGMGQFYRLVEAMHDVEASLAEPDYSQALRYLQANRQNRSLILLLTDPTGQEAAQGLVGHLGAFYPRHLPICVVLSDPAVLDAAGRRPYSVDAIYQRAVAEQIMHERQLWLSRLNQRGVQTLDVPAYQLTASVINRYLELKNSGKF